MIPINQEHFDSLFQQLRGEGYSIDPPGYERLDTWTTLLMQVNLAAYCLSTLRSHKSKLGDAEDSYWEFSLLSSFVVTYGRCFAKSGNALVSLDPKNVFADLHDVGLAHNRIIELRNNLVAHNADSDLIRTTMAVKEEPDCILIKHLITVAIPHNELAAFSAALAQVERFVTISLNKLLAKIERERGKPLIP